MRLTYLALLLIATTAFPAQGQENLVAAAKRVSAVLLDSSLPGVSFERWLGDLSGVPTSAIAWEVTDCGEGGEGRDAPTCVEASVRLHNDTTAYASLAVAGIDGRQGRPEVWDLYAGVGNSFTSFKTLREWAGYVRMHRPMSR